MDATKMEQLVSLMTPEAIEDGLWMVDVFGQRGSMDPGEANEWRRRIIARRSGE